MFGFVSPPDPDRECWFVMRDLKRRNALRPAYIELAEMGFEVYTPLKEEINRRGGQLKKRQIPVISDLLFVKSTTSALDKVVEVTPTLQYRYIRGGWKVPMTVDPQTMDRFIAAVSLSDAPVYYSPEQIDESMLGKKVRVIGGPLNGFEGRLKKLRGTKKRRIFVEIPSILAVETEINPEFIQLID